MRGRAGLHSQGSGSRGGCGWTCLFCAHGRSGLRLRGGADRSRIYLALHKVDQTRRRASGALQQDSGAWFGAPFTADERDRLVTRRAQPRSASGRRHPGGYRHSCACTLSPIASPRSLSPGLHRRRPKTAMPNLWPPELHTHGNARPWTTRHPNLEGLSQCKSLPSCRHRGCRCSRNCSRRASIDRKPGTGPHRPSCPCSAYRYPWPATHRPCRAWPEPACRCRRRTRFWLGLWLQPWSAPARCCSAGFAACQRQCNEKEIGSHDGLR